MYISNDCDIFLLYFPIYLIYSWLGRTDSFGNVTVSSLRDIDLLVRVAFKQISFCALRPHHHLMTRCQYFFSLSNWMVTSSHLTPISNFSLTSSQRVHYYLAENVTKWKRICSHSSPDQTLLCLWRFRLSWQWQLPTVISVNNNCPISNNQSCLLTTEHQHLPFEIPIKK